MITRGIELNAIRKPRGILNSDALWVHYWVLQPNQELMMETKYYLSNSLGENDRKLGEEFQLFFSFVTKMVFIPYLFVCKIDWDGIMKLVAAWNGKKWWWDYSSNCGRAISKTSTFAFDNLAKVLVMIIRFLNYSRLDTLTSKRGFNAPLMFLEELKKNNIFIPIIHTCR